MSRRDRCKWVALESSSLAWRGKESSASDKLFSTPSVEDGAVGTPTQSAPKPAAPEGPRSGFRWGSWRW